MEGVLHSCMRTNTCEICTFLYCCNKTCNILFRYKHASRVGGAGYSPGFHDESRGTTTITRFPKPAGTAEIQATMYG